MAIPFEVPAKYAVDVVSGALVRSGALLKDSSSGQIVAHLQETGLGQRLISSAVNSPFSPTYALAAPSSLAANAQLVQLKGMMESLQMFQFANLAATVAGIGVSAIGFVMMNKKINGLQSQMTEFENRVEAWFRELQERDLRAHYSRLHGLYHEADQSHSMSNPVTEFLRIAHELAKESAFFRGEVAFLIHNDIFDIELFKVLIRSYTLCDAGRIECLLFAGELLAAHKVSKDVASQYNTLFDSLSPIKLAHKSPSLLENKEIPLDHLLRQELVGIHELVDYVRDIQDAAISKPYLIKTLIDREIDGYEYIQAITSEKERPLLLVEAG